MILPTGGGKSLVYQLPTLIKDGVSVVISPLIALMQDQVSALVAQGISAAMISSAQTQDEIENIVANAPMSMALCSEKRGIFLNLSSSDLVS